MSKRECETTRIESSKIAKISFEWTDIIPAEITKMILLKSVTYPTLGEKVNTDRPYVCLDLALVCKEWYEICKEIEEDLKKEALAEISRHLLSEEDVRVKFMFFLAQMIRKCDNAIDMCFSVGHPLRMDMPSEHTFYVRMGFSRGKSGDLQDIRIALEEDCFGFRGLNVFMSTSQMGRFKKAFSEASYYLCAFFNKMHWTRHRVVQYQERFQKEPILSIKEAARFFNVLFSNLRITRVVAKGVSISARNPESNGEGVNRCEHLNVFYVRYRKPTLDEQNSKVVRECHGDFYRIEDAERDAIKKPDSYASRNDLMMREDHGKKKVVYTFDEEEREIAEEEDLVPETSSESDGEHEEDPQEESEGESEERSEEDDGGDSSEDDGGDSSEDDGGDSGVESEDIEEESDVEPERNNGGIPRMFSNTEGVEILETLGDLDRETKDLAYILAVKCDY